MRIEVSANEYDARKLGDDTLKAVVEALDVDGYVVLGSVVDVAVLDAMKTKLDEDTAELLRRIDCDDGQFVGHLSQAMPCSREHIHGELVTNPLVIQITARLLGEGVHNHFYNCNTNMPGSQSQPLHRDAPHAGRDLVNQTTSIVVNVPLINVDETNGATEVWPGTHRIEGSTRVAAAAEMARRAAVPPVRALSRKGDAILRDPRLWHRGVPNAGAETRHMIAMVHSRWHYMRDITIPVTRNALHAFDDDVLTTRIALMPDDYDYLSESLRR